MQWEIFKGNSVPGAPVVSERKLQISSQCVLEEEDKPQPTTKKRKCGKMRKLKSFFHLVMVNKQILFLFKVKQMKFFDVSHFITLFSVLLFH